MKKFMFAAIAALVMVSVSNVFASSKMVSNAQVAPVDTVAPECTFRFIGSRCSCSATGCSRGFYPAGEYNRGDSSNNRGFYPAGNY